MSDETPQAEATKKPPKRQWEAKESFFDLKASHWVQIALTVVLGCIAYAQYRVYNRQAGIMETQTQIATEQNKLTKINERAFVFKRQIDATPIIDEKGNIAKWFIAPLWENNGATPTTSLKIFTDCEMKDFPLDGTPIYCPLSNFLEGKPFYSRFLGPHQRSHDEGGCNPMTPAEISELQDRRFFMFGYARYTDALSSDEHKSRFCQGVILSGDPTKPDGLVVQSIIAEGGNCADEVCEAQDRNTTGQHK